jgi:hypothetical protein
MIALFFIFKYFHNEKENNVPSFDSIGFIIFGLGAALVTFSLTLLSESEVYLSINLQVIMLLLGITIFIIYYIYSQKKEHPSLDLKLFRVKTFQVAVLGSALIRLSIGGIPFLLPLMFQLSFGLTAFQASLLILPYGIAMFLAKLLVRLMLNKFGFRKCLTINPILATSKATSLSSVFQQMSMSLGVCISSSLLAIFMPRAQSFSHFIPIQVFHISFLILSLLALVSLSLFTQLKNSDGLHVLKQ